MDSESRPLGDEVEAKAKPHWYRYLDLGVAGFVMSVVLTLAGIYGDARGSDIAARPLDKMLLYRDGEGDRSVLNAAFKLILLNAADTSHGDMLLKADLELGGMKFAMVGTVQPSFTADSDAATKCPIDSRCIIRPGLVAVEKPDEVLDIPGGSHLLTNLNFPIVASNCIGPPKRCARLSDAAASQALFRNRVDARLFLHFYADGEREMRCRVDAIDHAYLTKIGWSAIVCKDATVKGGPPL